MAIKFEKIEEGMVLWSKERTRMGNTTMTRESWYEVKIVSLNIQLREAMVSWNGNPPRIWYERNLVKLYRNRPAAKPSIYDRFASGGK